MTKKILVIIFGTLVFNTCVGMTTKQYSYQTDKKDNPRLPSPFLLTVPS